MTWGAAAQQVRAQQLTAAAAAGDLRYDATGRLVHRCHYGEAPGRLILATSDDAETVTALVASGALTVSADGAITPAGGS